MNGLIKGMPEFINIIGKQQHSTHDSALDIHILRVLNGVMSNPKYESLPNSDKTILKLAVIMHDIAKPEGVNDANHPNTSALYADNIMQKYSFNAITKDRIYELIKNHHWLEHYNQGINDSKDTAALFRHKNDYLMSKIFCEADLKGISDYIYNLYSTLLSKENQTPVEEEINNINKNGQIIFTSKIIKDELIPRTEYKGKTYKVINFNDLPSDFDLEQFGFLAGTTPDNLRLLIHTAHTAENLRVTNHISDIANESFLCTSLVSLKEKATHWNKRFGVCLEGENVNISNASTSNQESLDKKDFKIFSDSLTNKNKLYFYRETLPKMVKSELNLSDDEYIQLYNQISETRYESQIKDDEIYHAGDKQISGMDIKNAVKKAGDSILQNEKHNEVNIYNPKTKAFIAKTDSIQEIPQSYLDFAFENNLPVFILGA
ncbi:MAG: hypothetical protein LUG16_00385 [Candidatus Gastranaerophilales bacterium]|nr:hypothetical protein [Candidatus Gastranaerophilales bacterium]